MVVNFNTRIVEKNFSVAFLMVVIFVLFGFYINFVSAEDNIQNNSLAVTNFSPKKIRVLIVPGHESISSGAEFGMVTERNLVMEIGQNLQKYLEADGGYDVFITRDYNSYTPTFLNYFSDSWNNIIAWEKEARKDLKNLVALGAIDPGPQKVVHNATSISDAVKLYGITKWANDNNIDVMIHLHLNDFPGRYPGIAGRYSGFVVYIPPPGFFNGKLSRSIADSVVTRLLTIGHESNLPLESGGIIEDPGLIALGENNTAKAASLLIEYGYVYEKRFTSKALRSDTLNQSAYQTYLALKNFYNTGEYHPMLRQNQASLLFACR